MTRMILPAVAAAAFAAISAPAFALTPVKACLTTDISPTAEACSGYYQSNLLSGNSGDLQAQKEALALIGLDWDIADWNTVDMTKDKDGDAWGEFKGMSGLTWVGIHYGAGKGGPGEGFPGGVTAFYRFDAGKGMDAFGIDRKAISSVALYATGVNTGDVVPEPATWAMLIVGFGLVGTSMRRRSVGTRVTA